MEEQKLVSRIQRLSQIKADSHWALLAKSKILEDGDKAPLTFERSFTTLDRIRSFSVFGLRQRATIGALAVIAFLVGTFNLVELSLPGDSLYGVKTFSERTQRWLTAEEKQPSFNFEIASRRLDDLQKVMGKNSAKNLESARAQVKESVAAVTKSLVRDAEAGKSLKGVMQDYKQLSLQTEAAKSLGVEIEETRELQDAMAKLLETELAGINEENLTDGQKNILVLIREDHEIGRYTEGLEKLLLLEGR